MICYGLNYKMAIFISLQWQGLDKVTENLFLQGWGLWVWLKSALGSAIKNQVCFEITLFLLHSDKGFDRPLIIHRPFFTDSSTLQRPVMKLIVTQILCYGKKIVLYPEKQELQLRIIICYFRCSTNRVGYILYCFRLSVPLPHFRVSFNH